MKYEASHKYLTAIIVSALFLMTWVATGTAQIQAPCFTTGALSEGPGELPERGLQWRSGGDTAGRIIFHERIHKGRRRSETEPHPILPKPG